MKLRIQVVAFVKDIVTVAVPDHVVLPDIRIITSLGIDAPGPQPIVCAQTECAVTLAVDIAADVRLFNPVTIAVVIVFIV